MTKQRIRDIVQSTIEKFGQMHIVIKNIKQYRFIKIVLCTVKDDKVYEKDIYINGFIDKYACDIASIISYHTIKAIKEINQETHYDMTRGML